MMDTDNGEECGIFEGESLRVQVTEKHIQIKHASHHLRP